MSSPSSRDPQYSAWMALESQEVLEQQLPKLQSGLRTIRLMGTFVGASAFHHPGDDQGAKTKDNERHGPTGLMEPFVRLIENNEQTLRQMLLIGSRNDGLLPLDHPSVRMYQYYFVSGLAERILRKRAHVADGFTIRFTFVPEDIQFAHFFFDASRVILAPTLTPDTVAEVKELGNYLAWLGNGEAVPKIVGRMIGIFDDRFRQEARTYGEETWTFHRGESSSSVLVRTPFWRRTASLTEPFEWHEPSRLMRWELARNTTREFHNWIGRRLLVERPKGGAHRGREPLR